MKKLVLQLLILALAFNLSAKKLNVLLVLADDQGYGELSCNGNPYLYTPNLDRLARESYNFTNYHSCTTCAPTRAGLMTGMYSNKVGVWHTIMGRSLMDRKQETIANVFKENAYKTGIFGKWHLGDNYPYRPFDRGFDEAIWFKGGAIGQAPDFWGNDCFDSTYYDRNKQVKIDGFSTDVFTEKAIEFMKLSQEEAKPFFCYLALNAPHTPFNIESKYIQKFLPNKKVPSANYYAIIEKLDENFGKIESFLRSSGLAENTVVIYTTDNGSAFGARIDKRTNTVIGYNASMRDKKGSVYEGGHRVPLFIRVPNTKGGEISNLAAYIDIAPTLYDICGLKSSKKLDGISLKGIFNTPDSYVDRYFVTDTQRQESLSKERPSVVMKDTLRLVNRKELYDLSEDLYQQNNIAKDSQETVDLMLKMHDEYWDSVAACGDAMQPIFLLAPDDDFVDLNTHDRHLSCFWDQQIQIRTNRKTSPESFWYVYVPEDGEYSFELRRWAKETNLNLKDAAPVIAAKQGTTGAIQAIGYAFKDIVGAELIIGEAAFESTLSATENPQFIKFEKVALKAGEYKLFANFFLPREKMGAHYVRVTKSP